MQEPNTPRTLLQPMLISCGVLAMVAGFFVSLTLIAAALLIFSGN